MESFFLNETPDKEDIIAASERIKGSIHRTPLLKSGLINEIAGCEIYFKCENLQKAGAFKFRGASNAVLSLPKEAANKGVATHSSGNHAAALSLAAKRLGAAAYIVMPRTAPVIKKKAVESYGGKIVLCEPTLKSREETLEKVVSETGAVFIHPYDNYSIIAGQATAAKEIFEDQNDFDYIIAPCGGGGLLSGTALSASFFSGGTIAFGAEPKGADDAFRSLRDGIIYPSVEPKTIADGLLTSLSPRTFDIIKNNVRQIFTVEEKSIINAMKLIWERMKIIVEPSSAVPLAAILENPDVFRNKKSAVVLSGGNIDLDNLPWQ